jgi:outer membrane protein OmpA-like peptidoglycan-associated protein
MLLLTTALLSPSAAMTWSGWLVFFDQDSAVITAQAEPEIERAAAEYRRQRGRMLVTGYTERAGPAVSNQQLSEQRARVVADALARLGVLRSDMVVSGRGENDNRVPTAPGVPDPQNRRVAIILQ